MASDTHTAAHYDMVTVEGWDRGLAQTPNLFSTAECTVHCTTKCQALTNIVPVANIHRHLNASTLQLIYFTASYR